MKTTNFVAAAIGVTSAIFLQGTSFLTVLGRSPTNFQCYAAELLSGECSTNNQGAQCTVYIPSRGESGLGFVGPGTVCSTPLRMPL